MGIKIGKEKLNILVEKLGKFKYALVLGLIGVFLLMLPTGKSTAKKEAAPAQQSAAAETTAAEEKMSRILSQVDGAGKVTVMLTLKNGGNVRYQTDLDTQTEDGRTQKKTQTVFTSGASGSALICETAAPEYLGAVVVSEGAGSATLRLKLTEAVGALTGLASDKITILRMKSE